MKSIVVILGSFWVLLAHGQCTISWVGNTFGDNPHHVGNGARSMWVSPGGIVYTASLWDENGRNIGVYQQGRVLGAMGGTKQSQGSAIGGDSTWLFTAQQAPNAGSIGRYNRSTGVRDLLFPASTGTGDAIAGIAVFDGKVYVSDAAGGCIRVFSIKGDPLGQWPVFKPGALAVDSSGHVWVACYDRGLILEYDSTGRPGVTIRMGGHSHPSALYVDNVRRQLLAGDEGPDMNIKIYGDLEGIPVLVSTFGVRGGYLDTSTGIRGQTGDKRFTRIRGIARDGQSHLYVLNNPWGGSWDLGRNGATDIHCYDSSGNLRWTLQALNFEGNAAADPGSDNAATDGGSHGIDLYSGNVLYHFSGTGGGDYKANTIDPFKYPRDVRIRIGQRSRGEHFGQLACMGGHRILVASGQNPDDFYTYYFNPATDGYIAIPGDTIAPHVRNGFQLDSAGNIWLGREGVILLLPLRVLQPAANLSGDRQSLLLRRPPSCRSTASAIFPPATGWYLQGAAATGPVSATASKCTTAGWPVTGYPIPLSPLPGAPPNRWR